MARRCAPYGGPARITGTHPYHNRGCINKGMGVTQSDVPVPEGMFGDGDERLFKALCCKAYGTCAVASGLDYKRVCKAKKTKGSLGAEEETRRAEEGRCKVSNRGGDS